MWLLLLSGLFPTRNVGARQGCLPDTGTMNDDITTAYSRKRLPNRRRSTTFDIEVAGLQSGQPLFQSVNSLGTAVTGRALNRYNAWAAIDAV